MTVHKTKKDFSQMSDLEKLQEINNEFQTIASIEQKKQKAYSELNACYNEYKSIDEEIVKEYRSHAVIKGNYTTNRTENARKQLKDEEAGIHDKRTKPLAIITIIVCIVLALIATVLSFEDLYETEYGGIAAIARIILVCRFAFAISHIRRDGNFSVWGAIFIYGVAFVWLVGLYVRIEETPIVPILDFVWIAFFLIAKTIAKSMHPNIKKIEACMAKFEAQDREELAKMNHEIDAQMQDIMQKTYPEVETLKQKYVPLKKKINQLKTNINALKTEQQNAETRIKENPVLSEADKQANIVQALIDWLKTGKVATIKEGLKRWDYDCEAKKISDEYVNYVFQLKQESIELEDSIASIESQISLANSKAEDNEAKRQSEIDKFVADVEEKFDY